MNQKSEDIVGQPVANPINGKHLTTEVLANVYFNNDLFTLANRFASRLYDFKNTEDFISLRRLLSQACTRWAEEHNYLKSRDYINDVVILMNQAVDDQKPLS
jgi:hypothetical protein